MTSMQWANYPMGPQLRNYLGINDSQYEGDQAATALTANESNIAQLSAYVIDRMRQSPIENYNYWANLIEELNVMALSKVVIFMAEEDYRPEVESDYRALLAIGSSYLMEQDWEPAIAYLKRAHQVTPEEIAPYTNLAGIYYTLHQDEQVQQWCLAGLDVEANHQRLWELLASVYIAKDRSQAAQLLKDAAVSKQSYLGLSLAASLVDAQDHLLKAEYLEELYHHDSKDQDFLIEYTAALGLAGQFQKIPTIVWQAHRSNGKTLHWKLYTHAAQAHMAQEQLEDAAKILTHIENQVPDAPQDVIQELRQALETN